MKKELIMNEITDMNHKIYVRPNMSIHCLASCNMIAETTDDIPVVEGTTVGGDESLSREETTTVPTTVPTTTNIWDEGW